MIYMSKKLVILIFLTSITSAGVKAETKQEVTEAILGLIQMFAEGKANKGTNTSPILDCSSDTFKPTASYKSLSSWSTRHHQDAEQAFTLLRSNPAEPSYLNAAKHACTEAIRMRGAAHCIKPGNAKYLSDLLASKALCKKITEL